MWERESGKEGGKQGGEGMLVGNLWADESLKGFWAEGKGVPCDWSPSRWVFVLFSWKWWVLPCLQTQPSSHPIFCSCSRPVTMMVAAFGVGSRDEMKW